MKIRSDFVTNSSSSSFTLTLTIELKEGGQVEFWGMGDCEGECEYYQLAALKSPKQLCECEDVNELVEMLKNTVVNNGIYGEGFEEDGFTGSRCYDRVLTDDSEFICEVRERIDSMDDILQIVIQGQEEGYYDDFWCRTFAFDNETKEYTLYEEGCEFEGEGRGGVIEFTDENEATETDNDPSEPVNTPGMRLADYKARMHEADFDFLFENFEEEDEKLRALLSEYSSEQLETIATKLNEGYEVPRDDMEITDFIVEIYKCQKADYLYENDVDDVIAKIKSFD